MDNPPTFGEQLEAHRKAARLSKAKAATLLDISLGTWANYERGRTTPSPTTREQMLAKLAAEIPLGRKVLYPEESGTDAEGVITGDDSDGQTSVPTAEDQPRSFAAPPADLPAPKPQAECPPLEPERMTAVEPEPEPEVAAPVAAAKTLVWRR